jgi:hypothetical protein
MFDRIRLGTLFLICLVVPFIGCGSSTELDSISVTPAILNFGGAGLSAQLTATGTVGHGSHPSTTENVTDLVTWSSDAPEVATVSSTGLVTSVGPGSIQITASINGFPGVLTSTATVNVTITTTTSPNSGDVTSVAIVPGSQSVAAPGQTGQFVAIGTTAAGTTENVTSSVVWGSTVAQVATITQGGLASAVGQGATTITAIATNPDKTVATGTATFTVSGTGTVATEPYSSVTIIPGSQTVPAPGATAQFIAIGKSGSTGLQEDITTQVAWKSSSSTIATINSGTGLATGVGQGTAAITAVYTNPADQSVVTGSATFTVSGTTGATPEPVSSITIIPATLSVSGPGLTGQFIALGTSGTTGLQTNITTSVTWGSSTAGVATIGANTGLATAVGQGASAITAIYTNPDKTVVSGAASFTVTGATSPQAITSLAIIPGSQTVTIPPVPPTTPTVSFVAIGSNASTGLQQDLTKSSVWSSSNQAVASIGANSGQVTLVGQGTTTITAEYTTSSTATTPATVVTATATLAVSGQAEEPLQSIAVLPASGAIAYPGQTSQLTAIGTYSTGPATQNLTSLATTTWTSSNTSVATVCSAATQSATCTPATYGLVTATGQGTAAITVTAPNPDKSVVTGVATVTVTNGVANQVTALTIIPNSITLSASGQPGQFIALATFGTSGVQQDVTNSPQLTWSSSNTPIATVCTQASAILNEPANCATTPGQVQGVSVGSTNVTAEFTNPVSGSSPNPTQVASQATVTVANTPAAEPLLSIAIAPISVSTINLEASAQFLAFGSFSTAPSVLDITNGFYHAGIPNASCTAAFAAADLAAAQAGTAAPYAQCTFVPTTWVSLPFPFDFPINSAGAPGAFGGLITADGTGTEDVYATAPNPDGTIVYPTNTATFNCPYAAPTYGTTTVTNPNGTTTTTTNYNDILTVGSCNALTVGNGLLSTLTVFNASLSSTGLNDANWLITASSATGTPDVIHCGGPTEQATPQGSVCEATYPNGTVVTLTAPTEPGVNFGGWSSSCLAINPNPSSVAGPNTCTVVVGGGCTLNPQTQTYICSSAANVSVGGIFN